MRIVQIIDSLDIGGAEKMAVNYANSLAKNIEFSGLIATRKEGELITAIHHGVSYLFLDKKKTIDIKSVLNLKKYCKKNKVDTIQSHSSSIFIACMVKLLMPKINIIWHVHNGNAKQKSNCLIQLLSILFQGIVAVNFELEEWSKKKLFCKNVIYLQNYIIENDSNSNFTKTILEGQNGKRVLYLANLRNPKNHLMLIEVIKKINKKFPSWTFHLVGNDMKDFYSDAIKMKLEEYSLQKIVFLYGSKIDVENIIKQSDVGVITSNSEGLPVSLIEIGYNKKPVVVTNVGQIPFLVQHNASGYISVTEDVDAFSEYLSKLLIDDDLRIKFGEVLHKTILDNYSEKVVIKKYLSWISKINQ
jgi:glycosyltransferase involved in cell wall biosynthesis